MKIGFDAKRAYHNSTGLGNYSRTLIKSLASLYPQHDYYLFNPKVSKKYHFNKPNIHEILPLTLLSKMLPSLWRSKLLSTDLVNSGIDIYHGLSHEIPFGLKKKRIKSVVTIHDLIPERFPEQYKKMDVRIYHKKFLHACRNADKIIAISLQTKKDIIEYYNIPEEKIVVCYQSCDQSFSIRADEKTKKEIAEKYNLPPIFYLYVGSIIERKNLLAICKAVKLLKNNVPLVIIGDGKNYKDEIIAFIGSSEIRQNFIFLSERLPKPIFTDLPVIYQLATAMIYPSFFEGFGLPVMESLCSGLPVITSNVSCLPEAGGDAAIYVNPNSPEQIADAMALILQDPQTADAMKEKGFKYAQQFSLDICTAKVMDVYLSL